MSFISIIFFSPSSSPLAVVALFFLIGTEDGESEKERISNGAIRAITGRVFFPSNLSVGACTIVLIRRDGPAGIDTTKKKKKRENV